MSEEMKKLRRCLEKLVREYPNGIIMSAANGFSSSLDFDSETCEKDSMQTPFSADELNIFPFSFIVARF